MRGAQNGPFGEPEGGEAESRRLTPSIGLAESDPPSEVANEDFLFHLYRGSELLQDNRAHEAKEELERALHLQPHDAKGQDLLAVVYFRLGLYPRAISIYEQLRRTSPKDPALLLNLALCYLKTGQVSLARRDLETLLTVNPSHVRAWGYLGLACERLGDLRAAQRAFEQGGHAPMARRMADRRATQAAKHKTAEPSSPSLEVRQVIAAVYEELDAGELSFALAEPASDSRDDKAPDSWRSVELGQVRRAPGTTASIPAESEKPDTKDGPPPPPIPHRPTLMVGVPPPHDSVEVEVLSQIGSARPPPAFVVDAAGSPSLRRPVVVVPPVRPAGSPLDGGYDTNQSPSTRTLPPPPVRPPSAPPLAAAPTAAPIASVAAFAAAVAAVAPSVLRASTAPPPAEQLTRESVAKFPTSGSVVIHPSGVALVRAPPASGFSARLEALRASSNALGMKLLERHVKGKSTGESFGGASSPLVHATGEGQLVLAPRPGRTISSFALADDLCFVREEVLLGFDGELAFENGRLATGEGEFVAVVQLRGTGAVLLEAIGEVLTLEVQGDRGLSVRREAVLGWFGRLVPRALAPSDAPCGQRGLVSFAGEGRVLVASA